MGNPNANWNHFTTRIIQRDVSNQVSLSFLNAEEQTNVQLVSMGQEMKNLRSELIKHRVNALEDARLHDPKQKGQQNATRFCNYCRISEHTPKWCRKRMQDDKIRQVQNDITFKKNIAPT